jgi:2-polyprenyl-3-methyl-5-hydroxy-6-metoxy-1,4-benzoquinol methylase
MSEGNRPEWWNGLPVDFRERCNYISLNDWQLSSNAEAVRKAYGRRFGSDLIDHRIAMHSWKRADICCNEIPGHLSLLDIGSGLGEFVNLFAGVNSDCPVSSVDIADFDLWFDHCGRVQRIYSDVLDLGGEHKRDVVSCFQVLEHVRKEHLSEVISKLFFLARKKLYVSVPFMEPVPIYRGHFSRFEAADIMRLFPDAKYTMIEKSRTNGHPAWMWILCEIDRN